MVTAVLWWALARQPAERRYALGCAGPGAHGRGLGRHGLAHRGAAVPEARAAARASARRAAARSRRVLRLLARDPHDFARRSRGRRAVVAPPSRRAGRSALVPVWLARRLRPVVPPRRSSWWLVERMRAPRARAGAPRPSPIASPALARAPARVARGARRAVGRRAGAGGRRLAAAGHPAAGQRPDRPQRRRSSTPSSRTSSRTSGGTTSPSTCCRRRPRSCSSITPPAGGSRGASAPSANIAATTSPCRSAAIALLYATALADLEALRGRADAGARRHRRPAAAAGPPPALAVARRRRARPGWLAALVPARAPGASS